MSAAEQATRRGKYYRQPPFPLVLGYDLVGVVKELAARDDRLAVGTRVAALTKTGAWAEQVVLATTDLAPVPDGITDPEAETVVTNGLTALRVLRRTNAPSRATIVVLGSTGGVRSILVQLAVRDGLRVVGVAGTSGQERLRSVGAITLDYRIDNLLRRVRDFAPDGVAGVVDHVGGPGLVDSWRMLGPGGELVSLSDMGVLHATQPTAYSVRHYLRLHLWNLLPKRRDAHVFDLWAGKKHADTFHPALHHDLTELFALIATAPSPPRSTPPTRSPTPAPPCDTLRTTASTARSFSFRNSRQDLAIRAFGETVKRAAARSNPTVVARPYGRALLNSHRPGCRRRSLCALRRRALRRRCL